MGLLPLIAWLFAHSLTGGRGVSAPSATPELLFFALSASGTALLSLGEDPHRRCPQFWMIGGLVVTILSAVFYGEYLIGEALHAAIDARLAYLNSRVFAGAALVYGAVIEGTTHSRSSP